MGISLNQFVTNNEGLELANPDGSYPGQCVSLVQQYLLQCLDIPFERRGNAKDWVNLPANIAVEVTDGPKAGDLIIWPTRGGGYGHIAIAISETEIFEQNAWPNYVAQRYPFTDAIRRAEYEEYVFMRPTSLINTPTPDPATPDTPDPPVTETFSITGYGLYVNKLGLNVRSEPNSSSTKLVTVPVGGELKIREFLYGFQTDGYQWAATEYNGHKGYSQIDTYGYYTVLLTNTSVVHPESGRVITPRNLYVVASSSGAYIKASPTSSSKTFISPGSKMKVLELLPGFQADGYQYAKVNYNGNVEGYVQIDVKSWHYFQVI